MNSKMTEVKLQVSSKAALRGSEIIQSQELHTPIKRKKGMFKLGQIRMEKTEGDSFK